MNKYKICVYAICKNESKFVNRFMDALKEIQDHVYILDTGSTDNTVELFEKRGAHIIQKHYEHFTFDKARNDSLNLVPKDYDICICLDIDDIIRPGFIEVINEVWDDETTQLNYPYYYHVDENDNPIGQFMADKIHSRNNYSWVYPVHEVLSFSGEHQKIVTTDRILVIQKPDHTKSREFYLDLLEERVREYPEDSRNTFLLAREYNSKGRWMDCIETARKYLELNDLWYKPEKVKVECLMANSYRRMQLYEEAEFWANAALKENVPTREPYLEKIIIDFEKGDYIRVIKDATEALKILDYNVEVIDSPGCFDGTIYDYLSLAYYYLEDYDNAIKYIDLDIRQNPKEERLKENRKIFMDMKRNRFF